jgi:hypothetical protein
LRLPFSDLWPAHSWKMSIAGPAAKGLHRQAQWREIMSVKRPAPGLTGGAKLTQSLMPEGLTSVNGGSYGFGWRQPPPGE